MCTDSDHILPSPQKPDWFASPFVPSQLDRSKMSSAPTALSSQNVTLPFIPELYDPNFMDVLLPASVSTKPKSPKTEPAPKNAMVDALKSTAHQTLTQNAAMAYSSTLVATLDAFHGLTRFTFSQEVDKYLSKSWTEDQDITLRIIWNLRSIHDGKGENEVFYR
jgi:Domain of unknown function (DUF2828)